MNLPDGRLLRSRVVSDVADPLAHALDRRVTGYAVLQPQDALLLDGDARGVVTFEDGLPVLAYHTETERGGPEALADLATPGPYRLELVALPPDAVEDLHGDADLTVPPGMPAARLAGDQALAERTRERAPAHRRTVADGDGDETGETGAVEAFLDDAEKIQAIREQARAEARDRAAEWGLSGVRDDSRAVEHDGGRTRNAE